MTETENAPEAVSVEELEPLARWLEDLANAARLIPPDISAIRKAATALRTLSSENQRLTAEVARKDAALRKAKVWLDLLIDEADVEPEETDITVSVVGPEGKREVAKLRLSETLEEIAALAPAKTGEIG